MRSIWSSAVASSGYGGKRPSRLLQDLGSAVELRQQQKRLPELVRHAADQLPQGRQILHLQHLEQLGLELGRNLETLHQAAEHADVTQVHVQIGNACCAQRIDHQRLDLHVAFHAGVAIQLGTHLQRLARMHHPGGQRMQNAARVAQPRDAGAVQQMGVDACHLRGDVRPQARAAGRTADRPA